jgi:hypothetical protein
MRALTVAAGLSLLVGTADAQELRAYPDMMLTSGSIDPTLTPEYICSHSTSERRSVTTALKKKVFAAYSVPFEDRANYEVDHFIPLALGGVNTCTDNPTCNLWPEPHQKSFPEIAPWGSETKDRLELRLYKMMCAGQISLHDAQVAISTDWEAAYRQYVAEPLTVATTGAPSTLTSFSFTPFTISPAAATPVRVAARHYRAPVHVAARHPRKHRRSKH